ncbi:phospholipid/cholesterol/gamma-HCH transport system permease protein [Luteibacter rhizovicinus]|uniref:Phospholipid/cholesterol/gamma-HCH transport system permease protein n=1 Tax=Luteibacter rhizovicinus TaxID=242606 RepID=A0A4R3YWS2_9GAMM|nr:ABC transporter permease [Luteibacter rhizovicinus]TCV95733.1 phospholipid/cholesterol/gamma-HCH transport system permease protein [Luteibacter rhizovicinus]
MTTTSLPGRAKVFRDAAASRLALTGDWTLPHYVDLQHSIAAIAHDVDASTTVDARELGALDTSGALVIAELLGSARTQALAQDPTIPVARRALLKTVGDALDTYCHAAPRERRSSLSILLERIGRATESFWKQSLKLLGFIGMVLQAIAATVWRPKRWRVTALVSHIEQTGLDAVPILSLLSFMVGAVVAFLGATALATYGASVFVIDLIGFAFLREFGVLLTAILLAGRTASAFTAQIGSMKAREEIDAIRTLGLDPIELLVLPRVLALLVALPLLTFIAMVTGILGGAVVCFSVLHMSPAMFLSMFRDDMTLGQLLVGMAKAPVFAFLIGVIGCMEGFKVSGSAQSVGEHTTSSVVQSLFVVILIDAAAALFYMEMGW